MNLEDEGFYCQHCERRIRYERPLFCPYCGKQVDPTQGLLDGMEVNVYPASKVAPLMMKWFLIWLALVFVVTLMFAKIGFVIMSFVLVFGLLFLYVGQKWFQNKAPNTQK